METEFDKRINMFYISESERLSSLKRFFSIYSIKNKLDRLLDTIFLKHDVVLLSTHLPFPHFICRLSKYRKNFLFVLHNPHFQFKYSNTVLFKKLLGFLYKKNNLIAVSDGVKNEIIDDFNVPFKNIRTIYNPLNFKKIDIELNSKEKFSFKEDYILFCGRLTKQKRPDVAIEAFYQGGFYQSYKLVILGVGEDEDQLKELVRHYAIEEHVVFLGWRKNPYIWMKHAKLLLCTSDYESFGMILAEALYCGCPVVSTNCKFGPDEILIEQLSYYLTSFKIEDIIEKINNALEMYPNNLKLYVKKFDGKNLIEEYLLTYEEWKNE